MQGGALRVVGTLVLRDRLGTPITTTSPCTVHPVLPYCSTRAFCVARALRRTQVPYYYDTVCHCAVCTASCGDIIERTSAVSYSVAAPGWYWVEVTNHVVSI